MNWTGKTPQPIEEFAARHRLRLIVGRRDLPAGAAGRYMARFHGAEVGEPLAALVDVAGNGATGSGAIADYAEKISGRTLVVGAGTPGRRDIPVPWLCGARPAQEPPAGIDVRHMVGPVRGAHGCGAAAVLQPDGTGRFPSVGRGPVPWREALAGACEQAGIRPGRIDTFPFLVAEVGGTFHAWHAADDSDLFDLGPGKGRSAAAVDLADLVAASPASGLLAEILPESWARHTGGAIAFPAERAGQSEQPGPAAQAGPRK